MPNYKTDEFKFRRRALIESLAPMDFTYETSCIGLTINGTQDIGQNRRVIFKIDDNLYKFGNSGLINYNRRLTAEDVLQFGNTVEELLNADCSQFVGKIVYPVIALECGIYDAVKPKIKIAAKVKNFNDVYTRYEYSGVYKLTDNAKIANISYDINTLNNGIATPMCRLLKSTGWTDWLYFDDARYQVAQAIQFRIQYILSAIDGSDVADISNVQCRYVTDKDKFTGDYSVLVTKAVDFDANFKTCYALVNCSGSCRAFITFGDAPLKRENLSIGNYFVSDGIVDKNVDPATIKINSDNPVLKLTGKQIDFDFDTADSTINVDIENATASWVANYPAENWIEMQNDGNRFTYQITGNAKVSAVKFICTGNIERYIVGWKA